MTVTPELLLNFLFSLLLLLLGWLIKIAFNEIKTIRSGVSDCEKVITNIRVDLPTNYVNKNELRLFTEQVLSRLDDISRKLDTKADKSSLETAFTKLDGKADKVK